jgi:hypothetical protein
MQRKKTSDTGRSGRQIRASEKRITEDAENILLLQEDSASRSEKK